DAFGRPALPAHRPTKRAGLAPPTRSLSPEPHPRAPCPRAPPARSLSPRLTHFQGSRALEPQDPPNFRERGLSDTKICPTSGKLGIEGGKIRARHRHGRPAHRVQAGHDQVRLHAAV